MALYVTENEATARLGEVTGLSVPAGATLTALIKKASILMEEYIGYAWADVAKTETIDVDRAGMGQLLGLDPLHVKLKSVTSVAIPASAQYEGGLAISSSKLFWTPYGQVGLQQIPTQALNEWGQVVQLYAYPQQMTVNYTAGPVGAIPSIFEQVCIDVIKVLILQGEDSDMLVSSKIDIKDMGLETENTFLRDAVAKAMHPLGRYRKD